MAASATINFISVDIMGDMRRSLSDADDDPRCSSSDGQDGMKQISVKGEAPPKSQPNCTQTWTRVSMQYMATDQNAIVHNVAQEGSLWQ
jgi:hypothetical protein